MESHDCLSVFETIGNAFNSPNDTNELLQTVASTICEGFDVDGCAFWLISRDQSSLTDAASWGLSEKFRRKGPIDSTSSVVEALDGHIVAITDCPNDPRIQYRAAFAEEGIVSLLALPLATRGQIIGVLRLYSRRKREFTDDEKNILKVIASFCAAAVVHSMFQKILKDVSETVRTSLVLDEVLKGIVRVITEDLRAKGCLIRLLDAEGKKLVLGASYGLSQAYLDSGPRDAAKAFAETIEGKPIAVYDAADYLQYPQQARREGVASLLSVPLLIHGRSIGVLRIYTHRPYRFSEGEIRLVSLVGEFCALLIRNAQRYTVVKDSFDSLVVEFHNWFDRSYGPGAVKV